MTVQLKLPYAPMDAKGVDEIPLGDEWQYEPKWDGFRAIVFRDGDHIQLQSKAEQSLERYFPELVRSLKALRPKQFVFDGEIVIPIEGRLDFDDLLLRIHPAQSRIDKLSREQPAMLILFDMLADESGSKLVDAPLLERRRRLEEFAERYLKDCRDIKLSPVTTDVKVAKKWLNGAGGNLDGLIAKRTDMGYQSNNRLGMQKIKPVHTVDCVIGGFRFAEGTEVVGSLLLGLYDDQGLLHHVGYTSSLKKNERPKLTQRLTPFIESPGFTGRAPGGKSRWSTRRSAEWQPLKPHFIVEVSYDHFTGGRFRHGTTLMRWRSDKKPENCTMEQVAQPHRQTLKLLRRS